MENGNAFLSEWFQSDDEEQMGRGKRKKIAKTYGKEDSFSKDLHPKKSRRDERPSLNQFEQIDLNQNNLGPNGDSIKKIK